MSTRQRELTGRHVAAIFCTGFGIIIAVNLVMARQAITTFPGLEVKNSYVASQGFDARRGAQEALGWQAAVTWRDGVLALALTDAEGRAVTPAEMRLVLGRASHDRADRPLALDAQGRAVLELAPGAWELRIRATAPDGTAFDRRLPFRVRG